MHSTHKYSTHISALTRSSTLSIANFNEGTKKIRRIVRLLMVPLDLCPCKYCSVPGYGLRAPRYNTIIRQMCYMWPFGADFPIEIADGKQSYPEKYILGNTRPKI